MPTLSLCLSDTVMAAHEALPPQAAPMLPWGITDTSSGETYGVWPASIQAMMTMGLGSWPLSSIAVSASLGSTFYQPLDEVARLDLTAQRSRLWPPELLQLLDAVGRVFQAQGIQAYIIGGLVRDAVMALALPEGQAQQSPDVDITIEGEGISAAHVLQEALPNIVLEQTFEAYGTAKLRYGTQPIDVASTRMESYTAMGVMPRIDRMGVSLAEDVMRRDFTVNTLALALHESGQVRDTLGGLADLSARMLRLLTPHSCYEDPSRIIRAFKYAIRLDFQWSDETTMVIEQSLSHIARFSTQATPPFEGGGERVRIEWHECLTLPESSVKTQWLSRFFELGTWRVMLPSLPASAEPVVSLAAFANALVETASQRDETEGSTANLYWLVCLLTMPDDQREAAMARLGCRKPLGEAISQCKTMTTVRPNPFDSGIMAADAVAVVELCSTLSPLTRWFLALTSQNVMASVAIIETYTHSLAAIKPVLTGHDLQTMGVPPGPRMGELLKELLHAKLLGSIVTVSDERDWIQSHLTDSTS